jgi:predicted dehydrogenase
VVYNALVDSLHAQLNQYALNAGKHVLSEKPFARNAVEASLVRNVARTAPGQIVEGFHYLHHPVIQRLRELVTSGELGDIQQADIELNISAAGQRSAMVARAGRRSDDGSRLLRAQRRPSGRPLVGSDSIGRQR